MRDVLIILGILVLVIGGLFWLGLPYWGWFIVAFGLLLAGFEIVTRQRTGQTLSQRLWAFRGQHPVWGWVIIAVLGLAMALLVVHLAWKTI